MLSRDSLTWEHLVSQAEGVAGGGTVSCTLHHSALHCLTATSWENFTEVRKFPAHALISPSADRAARAQVGSGWAHLWKGKIKALLPLCRPVAGGVRTGLAGAAEWASSPVPGALICCFILDFYFVKVARPPPPCFVSPWGAASFLLGKARCPDLCLQWIGPRLGLGLLTEALYITEPGTKGHP